MQVQIDDAAPYLAPEGKTVAEILDDIQTTVSLDGLVVEAVLLDGRPVLGEENEETLRSPATGHQQLHVTTVSRQRLCRNILEELSRYCPNLAQSQVEAAEMLRDRSDESKEKAILLLRDCFNLWAVLSDSLNKIATLLRVNLDELTINSQPMSELVKNFIALAAETQKAMDARELKKLADLLDKEWTPLVDQWAAAMELLKGKITV